ncbi:MAG TPA: hypothetical protein VJX95_00550 [Oscillospiraceae bacterium]|nr:hypothetical protein [Oscillospiraceae bacterium]
MITSAAINNNIFIGIISSSNIAAPIPKAARQSKFDPPPLFELLLRTIITTIKLILHSMT